MALKLKVQGASAVGLKPGQDDVVRLHTSGGVSILPPSYEGATEVTPDETEQTLATNGLMMPDDVTVHAIDSEYIGSDIPRRDITDVSVVADDVTFPGGYYADDVGVSVSSGSVSVPSLIEAENPSITVGTDGTIRAAYDKTVTVTPNLVPGYVSSVDAGSVRVFGSAEEHMTARHSGDLIVSGDTVTAPSGYYPSNASASVQSGSATTPTGGITANPTITVGNDGLITASVSKSESITPIVSEGYVTSGTAGTITFSGSATSQMTARSSADLTASGDTVTAPAGYYPSAASKAVAAGSATTPATSITANPSISVDSSGLITATASASQSVTPTVSAGYVSSGTAGTVSVSGSATEQLDTQAGTTITPTTSEQTVVAAGKYTTGAVKVSAMPNGYRGALTIVQGYNSGTNTYTCKYNSATSGYYPASTIQTSGTVTLTQEEYTVTPDTTTQTVTPTDAYHWIKKVTVNPIPGQYIVPTGTLPITSNGTGIDVTNYAAVDVSVSGGSPNLQTKTNIDPLTASQTITADAGYDGLDSVQINAMPSGVLSVAAALSSTGATASVSGTNLVVSRTGVLNVTSVSTPGYVFSNVSGNTDLTLYTPATNLESGNIKDGVTIFGVTGTYTGGGGTVSYDTKTVTASNYPVSLSFTGMKGQPKMFVCRLNVQVSSSGSTTYYYIVDVVSANGTTHGNCFRIGSTRRVDNITSGYSWTYTGTTLTITSSAASRSASPGAFYSGSYELIYCY